MTILYDDIKEPIKVKGILGSIRNNSFTKKALEIALLGAQEFGANIELIELSQYNLPFCDGGDNKDNYHSDVLKLRNTVKEAHGIILATPEYHGSFSGVLKNALDLMGFNEFEGKMVGLLGVAGGVTGAINSLNMLGTVTRQLRTWVVPHHVSISQSRKAFSNEGKFFDDNLLNRTLELGRQVAKFSYLHNSNRIKDFVEEWEKSVVNPGEEIQSY
ncbi:MAG: NADPH-dependent FMN reductase [Candidatus Heimdallarchaeota archaeon]